jgi:hypothetical protein
LGGLQNLSGARELERTIEPMISKPLAEALLAGSIKSGAVVGSLKEGIVGFRAAGWGSRNPRKKLALNAASGRVTAVQQKKSYGRVQK